MSELDKIFVFLNGLMERTKKHVAVAKPSTLEKAINTAQIFAAYHYDDKVNNKFIRNKGIHLGTKYVYCFNCGCNKWCICSSTGLMNKRYLLVL